MTDEKTIEKKLGGELDLDIKLDGAQAVITIVHEGSLGFAKFEVGTDAVKLIDKITDMIPGDWDDALIDGLAEKLLSKKTGE